MAMERFRNSSESVGSDGVFIEDSYYQGMLKAMDCRKGRVCYIFSIVLAEIFFVFSLQINYLIYKKNFYQVKVKFLVIISVLVESITPARKSLQFTALCHEEIV